MLHFEAGRALVEHACDPAFEQPRRLRRVELGNRHRQQLFAGITKSLADDVVHLGDPTVRLEDQDAVGNAVEDGAELVRRRAVPYGVLSYGAARQGAVHRGAIRPSSGRIFRNGGRGNRTGTRRGPTLCAPL